MDKLKETVSGYEKIHLDGELSRNRTIEQANKLDEELIELLLSKDSLRNHFFIEVGDKLVFDKEKFVEFVNNKQWFGNSYTKFKNKVGLKTGDEYYREKEDVELAWPYKDCVLQGGQTEEDEEREEKFWNKTLAPNQRDKLLDPKVLTNFKRYTEDGKKDVQEITTHDNLLIKGNNLLALGSLKKKFRREIEFIYIDPPFNTGSDSFNYNDNFSKSTYLTFMKNRLSQAKEFLSDEGVIALHCSSHQHAYLKVLMDEIFDENHLSTFNIQVRHPDRILTGDKEYNDIMEYIMFYSRTSEVKFPKKKVKKVDDEYVYEIRENDPDEVIEIDGKEVEVFKPQSYKEIKGDPSETKFKRISIRGSLREKNSSGRFYVSNLEKLENEYPDRTLFKVPGIGADQYEFRYFYLPPENKKNGGYYQGKPENKEYTEKPYPNYYNFQEEYNNASDQGGTKLRNAKKPEELLKFLMELFTEEDDLIMDFFLGSGTTAAVAHKMNRQYIGIEQLEYGENDPTVRLENVINGDSTGISDAVDWDGGGDFVYAELMDLNSHFMNKIEDADTKEEIQEIWGEMKEEAFLSYRVDIEKFDENSSEFEELDLEDQKEFLREVLDKNQLYVNFSEIDDSQYGINEKVKELNKKFYE